MTVIERAAQLGAAALTRPEPAPMCVGDVLYDHDWTPIEAARAVLEAVNYTGAVEALELIASRYDWDASACPKIAHAALVEMGLRPATTGGQ
jgi:hypothetical protein